MNQKQVNQAIYEYCLGVCPSVVDFVNYLIEDGVEPKVAIETAFEVMTSSMRENSLDS